MGDPLEQLAGALREARRVVILTGAGVSAESGIPTFRSAHQTMAALWKEFDPAKLATPEAFEADPQTVTRWYDWRRLGCLAAEPNLGHLALAAMERKLTQRSAAFTLLTQNVDRLHQKAGSINVVELHGNIITWRCTVTGQPAPLGPEPMGRFPMPSPHHPRGLLRPDVVWFGEMLPPQAVEAASKAVSSCDVFISIGTSSVVYPAAGFIHQAARRGAATAEINAEETPISPLVDWPLRGSSGVILPGIIERM
jgi:NAD-dependent deacetylase